MATVTTCPEVVGVQVDGWARTAPNLVRRDGSAQAALMTATAIMVSVEKMPVKN